MDYHALGKRIREERLRLNLTQENPLLTLDRSSAAREVLHWTSW